MWPYILSFLAGAFFPLALAGYGGHLAAIALPDDPKRRRNALIIVWTLAGAGVLISGVQQITSFSADHKKETEDTTFRDSVGKKLDNLNVELSSLLPNATTGKQQQAIVAAQSQVQALRNQSKRIEQEASDAPKMLLINTRIDLENAVVSFMESAGQSGKITADPIRNIRTEQLIGYFSKDLAEACIEFINLEDRLVNTMATSQEEFTIATNTGKKLIQRVQSLPGEIIKVRYANVALFSDAECTLPIRDATGLIIEVTSKETKQKRLQVFPTTVTPQYYKPGMVLSWEWNNSLEWGPTWYKDPKSGEIKKAFDSSMDFVPRDIRERLLKRLR